LSKPAIDARSIPEGKKQTIRNLFMSGIAEEFIALQLDLEIPAVIAVLNELQAYPAKGEAMA
jgi:hypothetical protein